MHKEVFKKLNLAELPTPCFVVDEYLLKKNLEILQDISKRSSAKILLALKSFSMWHYSDLISSYLSGICASGLHEAKLGKEYFKKEIHTYAAAYPRQDMREILELSNHCIFNSVNQLNAFANEIELAKKRNPDLEIGLRINPEQSEGEVEIYDPSAKGSRLGITRAEFPDELPSVVTGLHFHNLCEQNFAPLARTLSAVEEKFSSYLPQIKWINFGGGHHITRDDYEREKLIDAIIKFRNKYSVEVILEPGEAVALNTGVYVSEVLDEIRNNQYQILIMDGSCAAHLPDVLEMPYQPQILNAKRTRDLRNNYDQQHHPFNYRLGGLSCLSGDVFGDYSFPEKVRVGDKLVFLDMAHYTMVKTNTFNGVNLPTIVAWNSETDEYKIVKKFAYDDFKNRLS